MDIAECAAAQHGEERGTAQQPLPRQRRSRDAVVIIVAHPSDIHWIRRRRHAAAVFMLHC